ncbi:MAG: ATP-binding protein [Verrucomicrobiales bacterium]|nr:ATP-binding protein [Verrucomicrobiales bacterium]
MSVAPPDSKQVPSAAPSPAPEKVGILVIEANATTPLGPKIVFANETASTLTGYDLTSLIGSPLGLIYDHKDLPHLIRKLPIIAGQSDFCWMDRLLNRNGGIRIPVRWTIRPTQRAGDSARHFTLTFSPIPDSEESTPDREEQQAPPRNPSRIAETEETSSKEDLDFEESRSESLALAAGGVAHDFKNALQTIKSNLEMAHAIVRSQEKLQTYLHDAQNALFDAETLAKQMLAFTKGDSVSRCIFDVSDCLKRVSHLCTAGTRVRCRLQISPGLLPVEGDPNRIYQVLHNLVINACQAMPNGGPLQLAAVTTQFPEGPNNFSVPPGSYTVISVKDRGCGIPEDQLPHIFDKQFTTKEDGNGLGLASCQAIIRQHGGVIRAASREGVGTEFLIFLPSTDAPLPESPSKPRLQAVSKIPEKRSPGGGKILVVEDQKGVSKATCGMLSHLGYDSLVAETGEQALHLYKRMLDSTTPFDLVLLDMTLPGGLDGEEVLRELQRIDSSVTVIATSGYFEDGPTHSLIEMGFAGVLAKPYSMDSLAITVDQALQNRD